MINMIINILTDINLKKIYNSETDILPKTNEEAFIFEEFVMLIYSILLFIISL